MGLLDGVNNDVVVTNDSTTVQTTEVQEQKEEKINSTFTADEQATQTQNAENNNSIFTAQASDALVNVDTTDTSIYGQNGIELINFAESFSRHTSNPYIKEYESMEKEIAEAFSSGNVQKLGKATKRRQHAKNISNNINELKRNNKESGLTYDIKITNDYENSKGNDTFDYEIDSEQESDNTDESKSTDNRKNDNNLALEGSIAYNSAKLNAQGSAVLSQQRISLKGNMLYTPANNVQIMGDVNINVKDVTITGTEKFGMSYSKPEKNFSTGAVGIFEHITTNTDDGKKSFARANALGYINAGKNFSLITEYNAIFGEGSTYHTVDLGLETRGEKTFNTKNNGNLTIYGSLSGSAEYSKIENYDFYGGKASAEAGLKYTKNDFGAHVKVQGNYNGTYVKTDDIGYDGDYDISVSGNIEKKGAFVGVGYSTSSSEEFDEHTFTFDVGYMTKKGYSFSGRYTKGINYNKIDKTASSNSDSNLVTLNVGLPLDEIVAVLSSKSSTK